jgi:hypothetical protein
VPEIILYVPHRNTGLDQMRGVAVPVMPSSA